MRNRNPIFLNCFTQGGSNILWNMIVSHPDVCSPKTETHSCFENGINLGMNKTKRPWHWIIISWTGIALFLLTLQHRLFDVRNIRPRRLIPGLAERIIDYRLFNAKCLSFDEQGFKFKGPNVLYSTEELAATRFCSKGNNGLVFLNPIYRHMYPTVRFVGMVRHPLALYESWSRRNVVKTPEEFARFYNALAGKMISEQQKGNYKLVTFENLMTHPIEVVRDVYSFLGLDFDESRKLRLKAKKHYRDDGTYGTDLKEGQYYWFSVDEVKSYFGSGVSKKIKLLNADDIRIVLDLTEDIRLKLGYDERP